MNRSFSVRTMGLYRKANTHRNRLNSKLLVLVQSEDGVVQGYTSHTGDQWPEIHAVFESLGSVVDNLLGPDHFDTVADRSNGLRTSPSTQSLTTASIGSSQMLAAPNDTEAGPEPPVTQHNCQIPDHMAPKASSAPLPDYEKGTATPEKGEQNRKRRRISFD